LTKAKGNACLAAVDKFTVGCIEVCADHFARTSEHGQHVQERT